MAKRPAKKDQPEEEMLTTAIYIPKRTHELIEAVAFKRRKERGGRMSISGVIVDLVEENRKQLTKEAGPHL